MSHNQNRIALHHAAIQIRLKTVTNGGPYCRRLLISHRTSRATKTLKHKVVRNHRLSLNDAPRLPVSQKIENPKLFQCSYQHLCFIQLLGVLKRADDLMDMNDLQPNKRRRTNTINGPLNENSENAYRRIKGRQPISRMRDNSA